MPFTLIMPKLSPTMEEGVLTKWHKKVGDFVEAGDLLIEVATDKAVVEHNALDKGWIRQILINEGNEARVNQALAIMTETKEESIESYQIEGEKIPPKSEKPSPSTDSVKSVAQEPLARPKETGFFQPNFAPEPSLEKYEFNRPCGTIASRINASPLAKKIAKEKNLDLGTVKGSGPRQRIKSRDLDQAQPLGKIVFGQRAEPKNIPGSYDEQSLSPMRKAIAQRLQQAKTFIPHFYVSLTINAEPLVEIREQLRQFDIKITYNDLIIKACALALREHPNVNSGFDSSKNVIIQYKTIDISIAVSLESGLITPIIRHADYKNVGEISVEIRSLAKRAAENKLAPEEYKGGSFTISNLGMYGISQFQAIINPPQAAILAIGGLLEVPVVHKGQVIPGKTLNLTLSCDHRVVDGVAGAKFLKTLQNYLENPAVIMI